MTNEEDVPLTTYIAGMGAGWWSVGGQLLASVVILLSVKQDLGLRVYIGAALGSLVAIAFVISALVTATRANLRGGAAICGAVLCFEALLILRRQNKRDSQ